MIFDRDKVKRLKEKFKAGTRIRLIRMDDVQAPPPGTKGTVRDVDDIGNVLMKWDNGKSLSLIPGVDSFHTVEPTEEMTEDLDEGMEML